MSRVREGIQYWWGVSSRGLSGTKAATGGSGPGGSSSSRLMRATFYRSIMLLLYVLLWLLAPSLVASVSGWTSWLAKVIEVCLDRCLYDMGRWRCSA